MSLEECNGATGAANPEAIAALLDGNGELAAALVVPEKDTQALINLAKYQHQVLSEIATILDDSQGFAELMRETIRIKCGFVLRAAAKAGLVP
jgi:hypothetical protein